MIGHDHVEAFRQRIEDRWPFREPVGAVEIHQRHALAAARKVELAAVDLDRLPDKFHGPPAILVRPSRKGRGGRQPAQTFSKCRAVAIFLAARGFAGSTSKRKRSTVLPIATRIGVAGAILATGVRLKDKCTHLWRHAAHASRPRIDLADLRFPY